MRFGNQLTRERLKRDIHQGTNTPSARAKVLFAAASAAFKENDQRTTASHNRCNDSRHLGQSFLCQHHRCASGTERSKTFVRIPETIALQIPRQHGAFRMGIRGRSRICEHKMSPSTARREDADQWFHRGSELTDTFTSTLEL